MCLQNVYWQNNRAKNFKVWCINLEQFHGILKHSTKAKVITQNKGNTEYRIKEKDAGNIAVFRDIDIVRLKRVLLAPLSSDVAYQGVNCTSRLLTFMTFLKHANIELVISQLYSLKLKYVYCHCIKFYNIAFVNPER